MCVQTSFKIVGSGTVFRHSFGDRIRFTRMTWSWFVTLARPPVYIGITVTDSNESTARRTICFHRLYSLLDSIWRVVLALIHQITLIWHTALMHVNYQKFMLHIQISLMECRSSFNKSSTSLSFKKTLCHARLETRLSWFKTQKKKFFILNFAGRGTLLC